MSNFRALPFYLVAVTRYHFFRLASVIALAALAHTNVASADIWAYVDAQGRSHVADRRVDSRYQLFYKGKTTLDVPAARDEDRAKAIASLAGTPLLAHATDAARTKRYASLIDANARANGLDPALVMAVMAVESAFDPRAVSDKGAIGLMQVLPETAERYGVRGDTRRSGAYKLFDPATNVRVGVRYLRDLLARFENDLSLALAAYNAGEGAVAMHANRVPPFAETRDYVRLVRAVYSIYRPENDAPRGPIKVLKRTTAQDDPRPGAVL
jgi:soluble lytic murein transglycosylase-like protein